MKFKKIVITVTFAVITGREELLIHDYRKNRVVKMLEENLLELALSLNLK